MLERRMASGEQTLGHFGSLVPRGPATWARRHRQRQRALRL